MKLLAKALLFAASVLAARPVLADSYRLRADAFAAAAAPPVGLLVLQAAAKQPPWLDAEALVWLGAGDRSGDVLVLTAGLRDPQGRGALRFGRMLLTTGAVRPIHMDGALVKARMRSGPGIELFGGMPVEPEFGSRNFDWLIGQRLSVREERWTAGLSYLHRRDEGRVAFEEVGLDGFVLPAAWLSATAIAALDTTRGDLTHARSSVAAHGSLGKLELFATHRSPSLLLPATSLFAALGDQPSTDVGLSGFWRAAPRLDVSATASFESIGGSFAAEQTVRATLRLDDRGDRSIGLTLRRQSAADASWTGVRTTARMPLPYQLAAAAELEVAVPDHGGPRGHAWPWGLVALAYRPHARWEVAGALEAGASPSSVASLSALLRLSAGWDTRP